MREAILIVLSLFNIFLAFSKHFLIEVNDDKKGKVKSGKNTLANREFGSDYSDDDEDYEYADIQDDTEGKQNPLNVCFQFPLARPRGLSVY